jgi:hypothetical protein
VALVDCPECGRQVSTLAAACPHCGFPVSDALIGEAPRRERGPSRWTDPGFWVIVVGLAVVIVISFLLLRQVGQDEPSNTTPPAGAGAAAVLGPGGDWADTRFRPDGPGDPAGGRWLVPDGS